MPISIPIHMLSGSSESQKTLLRFKLKSRTNSSQNLRSNIYGRPDSDSNRFPPSRIPQDRKKSISTTPRPQTLQSKRYSKQRLPHEKHIPQNAPNVNSYAQEYQPMGNPLAILQQQSNPIPLRRRESPGRASSAYALNIYAI